MNELSLEQCYGKVFKKMIVSGCNNQSILLFEDGSFTTLKASHGYECCDNEICQSELDILDFGGEDLVNEGFITQEYVDNLRKDREDRFNRANEERERKRYEELKRKFG